MDSGIYNVKYLEMRAVMRKILIGLFILIVAAIIFMFVRSLYSVDWFNKFEYDKNVSPFDVFNLIISSIVAIGLGYYITKKLTEERFMKEYLIADIEKVENELENIESVLNTNNVDLLTVFNALNKLSHKIERIENTAKLIDFRTLEIQELKQFNYTLFQIATATDDSNRINSFQTSMQLEPIYNGISMCLKKIVTSSQQKVKVPIFIIGFSIG